MVEIRLDGEWLLARIQNIEFELNEIRRRAAMGSAPSPSVQGIDLTQIYWLDRDSEVVGLGAEWSWAFGYDQSGGYKKESETLVKAIEQSGKVEIDGYEMTLSGRDKRLLNRKKLKK